ncbi:MAG: ankyrin repeat domain-containing protein [Betaproteobacteria bacterium]|nr:ankyrin repeat domain-containing protein [Betaproteobacteria bacterium]
MRSHGECASIVKTLLQDDMDRNMQNSDGDTPLHMAAKGGNLKIEQLLIEFGANLNSRDKSGQTTSSDHHGTTIA